MDGWKQHAIAAEHHLGELQLVGICPTKHGREDKDVVLP